MSQCDSTSSISNEYLDDRAFKFLVYLWNNDERGIKIPRGSIQELVVNDDITRWYQTGHLVFKNPRDAVERVNKKYSGGSTADVSPMRWRGDGRDYIYIEIDIPISEDILNSESLNNEVYTFRFIGSVVDTQDVLGQNPDGKLKKIYFWDYRQEIMASRSLSWSAAKASKKKEANITNYKSLHLVSDEERSIYTGDAIKDIITKSLQTSKTQPEFETDFSIGGVKTEYVSPANSKASDDLEYMIGEHVHDTKNREPCLLRCNRYTDKWSLLPLSEYYKRCYIKDKDFPGEFLYDRFYLGDQSNQDEVTQNTQRIPENYTGTNNAFIDSNIIDDFEFAVPTAQDNNVMFSTTVVHIYDFKQKQFHIRLEESDSQANREYLQKSVLSNTKTDGEPGTSIVLNNAKKENKIVTHTFTNKSSKAGEALAGRNPMLKGAVFHGNTIKFSCKGFPSRQAGRFISIDRDTGLADSEFDDKVLGNYLVTNVSHVIDGESYTNEVVAVKPYTYKTHEYNEDIQ